MQIESKRHHVATAIQCYMKEHQTMAEMAIEKLLQIVEDMWEVFNQEYLHQKHIVPKALAEILLNCMRVIETLYRGNIDRFNEPEALKDHVADLLDRPII
jgi:(-)-germacrene D synthase